MHPDKNPNITAEELKLYSEISSLYSAFNNANISEVLNELIANKNNNQILFYEFSLINHNLISEFKELPNLMLMNKIMLMLL